MDVVKYPKLFFFASNQRMADLGPTRQLGLGQGVRHPNVESTDMTNFMNLVKNTFVLDLKIITNISGR